MFELAMNLTHTASPKSPDPDAETVIGKTTVSLTNGGLRAYRRHHAAEVIVSYKECLKNHAAAIGGHAVDGCGEFIPSPSATLSDPTSLRCGACGCHRNFHRRDTGDDQDAVAAAALPLPLPAPLLTPSSAAAPAIEYRPHHRHHPPPPSVRSGSPSSSSPPPISSSYTLLALSGSNKHASHSTSGLAFSDLNFGNINNPSNQTPGSRKRFRSKFNQFQKEKMREFAERSGWKMQGCDELAVRELCREIGVDRGVLKVWMHNHKNSSSSGHGNPLTTISAGGTINGNGGSSHLIARDAAHNRDPANIFSGSGRDKSGGEEGVKSMVSTTTVTATAAASS